MDSYNLHELKIEAGYYGLEELVSGIQGLIDKRTKTNTTLQPSKRLIIRIYYPDPTKDLLKIDPYPLPSFIKYDLEKLTKAFADGLEAMVNEMLSLGFVIDKEYWDTTNRYGSFVVMSLS